LKQGLTVLPTATILPPRLRRTLAAMLLACPWAAAQAAPDQLVTFVAGSAHAGKRPLRLLDPIEPGTRIVLGPGARLVVFRSSDTLETTLTGPGSFVAGREGIARAGAGGTLRRVRMDPASGNAHGRPGVRNAVQAGVTVRSGGAAAAGDTPCEGAAVAPGALVLRWRERAHTGEYGVTLAGEDERVLHAAQVAGLEAAVPDGVLAPGARYRWELTWRDAAGNLRLAACRFVVEP
jgi:hypothetical protein